MILVVEGVSSSGKTTRASHYAPAVVEEGSGFNPPSEAAAAGEYWSARNSERWHRGLELERTHEVVCFDADPLKIHYSWCLWQIGKGLRNEWMANVAAARERVAAKQLGFADRILFLEPAEVVVRRQKEKDQTRRRSQFETHLRLYQPLRCWYALLESLAPGRVVFNAHQTQEATPGSLRTDRYDLVLYDALIEAADRTTPAAF